MARVSSETVMNLNQKKAAVAILTMSGKQCWAMYIYVYVYIPEN